MRPAGAWMAAHVDACRGLWVVVRLVDSVWVTSASTRTDVWPMVASVRLHNGVLQSIGTAAHTCDAQRPGGDG